jgi:hypothetical protein
MKTDNSPEGRFGGQFATGNAFALVDRQGFPSLPGYVIKY